MKPCIPQAEFEERVRKTQKSMQNAGLDLVLCYGNEAEPQFVRYYSDYWPNFETAGVLIPAEGDALLLIGPESETFAGGVSKIAKIRRLLAFRESSEPEYPDAKLETFESVITEAMNGRCPKKIGIAGYSLINHVIYVDLERSLKKFGDVEVVRADQMIAEQRVIKTANEIACLREAYRITQEAMKSVIANIRVGMTENQVKGIAMAKIFEEGGEGEAYPGWVLTGKGSNKAIGRASNKVIQAGDLVHLQFGARYNGYASTMGRPVIFGKATPMMKKMIEVDLQAQRDLLSFIRAGVNAGDVCRVRDDLIKANGLGDMLLYGPIHGTGLMEGEYPWIESVSDYPLEAGMTFCTCLYLGDNKEQIGIRIEDGFMVTETGTESFSDYRRELIEL